MSGRTHVFCLDMFVIELYTVLINTFNFVLDMIILSAIIYIQCMCRYACMFIVMCTYKLMINRANTSKQGWLYC